MSVDFFFPLLEIPQERKEVKNASCLEIKGFLSLPGTVGYNSHKLKIKERV